MSVIVFLFLGMTISSEEIIKDRKILQRESFLNLSRWSYLNSKILIMFIISAIQTISFILIGNFVFEIKGMMWSYWVILFTTACFANMLGLNISAGLNSVITIYILVPFLLIPQILFSGVIVKFDKLHKSLTNYEYVPIIGDMMTSRWAYEALAVEQYKNNKYQKAFFQLDQEINNLKYYDSYLIPLLQTKLNESVTNLRRDANHEQTAMNLSILDRQIGLLSEMVPQVSNGFEGKLHVGSFTESAAAETDSYLQHLSSRFRDQISLAIRKRDQRLQQLIDELGGLDSFTEFRNEYENKKLSDIVLNRDEVDKIIEMDNRLIRLDKPGYMEPTSHVGRAHFYAPFKKIGNIRIDTMWFNLIFIWFTSLILYLTLYFDLLRKVITYFENIRLRRDN
jgi:hypothetical protein